MLKPPIIQKSNPKENALRPVWIHSLSAGTWPGKNGTVTITNETIQELAQTYSTELHESPAVLGHPKTDDPAYGWVRSMDVRPDGLWLNVDVSPELEQMVKQKKYKKVSVSIFPPLAESNPTPGKYYLKHLGFLGAITPAVKGLKPVSLSESTEEQIIIFSQKENVVEEQELADKQKAIELAESEIVAEREKLKAEKAAVEKQKNQLRRQELENMVDTHVKAGRVLPAQKTMLVAFAESFDRSTEPISLSEGEPQKELKDIFEDYLKGLPVQVNLSEHSAPETTGSEASLEFSTPENYEVDSESLAIDKKARQFMASNAELTYTEAVRKAQLEGA